MEQSKLKISIELERGCNLDVSLRDAIQGFLDYKEENELATEKQKELMGKHGIEYDDSTTKVEASKRISGFFDSKKKSKED